MRENKKGFFYFCRFWVRLFTHRYKVCPSKDRPEPAVYVVHHQNMRGPILSLAWFDLPARPWALSVFCSRKSCFEQYYNYTFTKRFGMPRLVALVLAFPLSFFISTLMNSMGAIPVFRGSREIIKTFKESVASLIQGENLLIFPDIDYTNESSDIGEIYSGFLSLEKYYIKETGRHLAFVPLHINRSDCCIHEGQAVYFEDGKDFKEERGRVYVRLQEEFLRLEG